MKKLVVCMVISLISFSAFAQENRHPSSLPKNLTLRPTLDQLREKIALSLDTNVDMSVAGPRQGFFDRYNKQNPYSNPMEILVQNFYQVSDTTIQKVDSDLLNNDEWHRDTASYKNKVKELANLIDNKQAYKNLLWFLQIQAVYSYIHGNLDYQDMPDIQMRNDISVAIGHPLEVDVCSSIFHENCDVLFSSAKN